jgi:tripartite-type tricarboxylate transporter receptor subunit TctC
MWRSGALLLSTCWLFTCVSLGAWAQGTYPTRPIRFVVPFPPGGIDTPARALTQKMSEDLGQPIVVENRAGANGNIGTEFVARSPADGHTLLFTSSGTMVIGLFVSKGVPFDPFRDFTPVMNVYESLQTVVVPSALPVKSLADFIDYARRNPGKLSYSSSGVGSWVHLAVETLKQSAGIDLLHVPYKGSGPMVADVASGRIDLTFPSYSTAFNFISGGKVRVLAIADSRRYPGLADIPALTEAVPGYQRPPTWIALFAPANLPAPITRRINGSAQKALDSAELKAFFAKVNAIVVGGSAEEFAATLKADWDITERLVKKLGIQPE